MEHGGDLLSYQTRSIQKLVDFSSNINPLGIPNLIEEAITEHMESLIHYPDIQYRYLKAHLANYLGCGYENVLVGNGAMEIIDLAIWAHEKIIVYYPGFVEYAKRSRIHNKELVELPLGCDFKFSLDHLEEHLTEGTLVVLGNPNNPTGFRINRETLISLMERIKAKGATLLLDEAFFEFVPEDYDTIQLFKADDFKHLIIVRAATKFFSLPGIRLGYGCAHPIMVKKLEALQLPWTVNALADAVGQTLNELGPFIESSKAYMSRERDYMLDTLRQMEEITVYETQANYILIQMKEKTEDECLDFMLERGFLIRTCGNYRGLDEHYIRVAIRSHEENKSMLHAFSEFLKG